MRCRFAQLWFVAGSAIACTPDWASPIRDASMDTSEAESEDDGGEAANVDGGDAAQSPPNANGADGGEPGEPDAEVGQDADTGLKDAAADAETDGGCAVGYAPRDGSCQDIDECFEGTHECHMTATCENTKGGYDCTCPLGYSGGTSAGFACAPRIAVGEDTGGAGEQHHCAVLTDNTVRCWGDNSVGQLGDGTNDARVSPVGVLRDAALISIGGRSACTVMLDGALRCWGDNTNGQLGDGSKMNRAEPTEVPGLMSVVSVSVGTGHACAVFDDGSIKCWGNNSDGQLGNGSSASAQVLAPIAVRGVSDAADVYAFAGQTCAVLRSGRAQCWGKGFLGDPAAATSLTPVDVKFPGAFLRLAIGPFHACGVQSDGDVVCWGPPTLGGNGTTTGDAGPKRVMGASATAVEIGIYSTCIIEPSGTMQWWDAQTKPVPVNGVVKAVAMSGSGKRLCHLDVDGLVSCWTIANGMLTQPVLVPGLDLW